MTFEEFKKEDMNTIELTQELYDELVHNSTLGARLNIVKALRERTDINQELFKKLEALTKRQYSSKFMSGIATKLMFEED